MKPLIINWPLSSMTGYGIYGLQILYQYLKRGGNEFALTDHLVLPIDLPPEFEAQLRPLLERASQAGIHLDNNPQEILGFDSPVLHGIGNPYATFRNQYRVKGRPNIGCAAIEEVICPEDWLPFLKIYDRFIAASRWTGGFLSSLNIAPVNVCHLGIDPTLFYQAASPRLAEGRFTVFSGGKFEFRKGQDIVVAAFKAFREKHPDALLVTSWQNGAVVDAAPYALAGHCLTTPQMDESGTKLDIARWLLEQGLPKDSFIDLGWQHNSAMPDIMRGCDMAIFPNRCEGGTNMVAKEALACGLPTIISANTGHWDLIELLGCHAMKHQRPVKGVPEILSVAGWGETNLEEAIAAMEYVYDHPTEAHAEATLCAETMKRWSWREQNEKLLQIVYNEG